MSTRLFNEKVKSQTEKREIMEINGVLDIGTEIADRAQFLKDFHKFLLDHDAYFGGKIDDNSTEFGVDCW